MGHRGAASEKKSAVTGAVPASSRRLRGDAPLGGDGEPDAPTVSPRRAAVRPTGRWAGYAAATWGFLFAAVSIYWAVGGRIGLGTIAPEIRERALAREAGFVAILWATGLLKVVAALLALALCRPWGRSQPRRLLLVVGGPRAYC